MNKPIQKFYSRFANYSTTYKLEDGKRIRISFVNHLFVTDDEETIKCIETDIKNSKEKGNLCSIQTIDEHELLKAQEVEYIIVDGEKVSTKDIQKNADLVKALDEENSKLLKELENLKNQKKKDK